MAAKEREPAHVTKRNIMMWAEFTWRVSIGDIGAQTLMPEVGVPGFDGLFGGNGWTVEGLFTLGNTGLRRHVREVAFGSLLHTVEDSFAKGHAHRETNGEQTCSSLPEVEGPGANNRIPFVCKPKSRQAY